MLRLVFIAAGLAGAVWIWPEVEADDRILWAAVIPGTYLLGMLMLLGGRS